MANDLSAYSNERFWDRINSRQGSLEGRRALYDDQANVICELFRPDLVAGKLGELREGAFEGSQIIEGTGPNAARIWQRGFQGGIMDPESDWFKDRARESSRQNAPKFKGNDEVNQYLQDFDDHMVAKYRQSNFYDVMPHFILDGGTVGSPVMLREENVLEGNIVCKVPHYSQRWLDKDIMGRDNVLHVKWKWSATIAANFFGKDNLPAVVQTNLTNGKHYEESEYLQVIYGAADPIFDDLPDDKQVPQTHPWMEFFIALDAVGQERKVLKPKNKGPGYFQRPFSSWHYWRNWHEVYSRTMAWWAIFDVRGNNSLWEALFGEAELSIRPPVWAMQAMEGLLNMGPAGEMYARDANEYGSPPVYVERKTRYDVAIDFANRLQESIERHFHVPLFMGTNQLQRQRNQPETAYGLFLADMERKTQLAPEVATYVKQVLSDNHQAFVEIEERAGNLPQAPDILLEWSDDGEVDVEFIGELARAQSRDRTINKFFLNIGVAELAFKWSPETVMKINWSQALERLLEAGNFPQADLIPEDEYQELVNLVRQREQQAQLMEQAPTMHSPVGTGMLL